MGNEYLVISSGSDGGTLASYTPILALFLGLALVFIVVGWWRTQCNRRRATWLDVQREQELRAVVDSSVLPYSLKYCERCKIWPITNVWYCSICGMHLHERARYDEEEEKVCTHE